MNQPYRPGPYGPGYPGQQPPQGYFNPMAQGYPVAPPYSGSQPLPAPLGGHQQHAPQQGMGAGRVVLNISYTPLCFILALFKPGITIDGYPGPVGVWGNNYIDLPAGQHQISVHVNYLWRFGDASAVVPVTAGRPVDVFYRAPATAFGYGAIGPVPQATPNVGLAILISVVPLVFAIILVILLAAI